MTSAEDLTAAVKDLATRAGFARVGVTGAGPVPGEDVFRDWLARGWRGGMDYLSRNVAKRFRPELLVPGARSVICLAAGYAPADGSPSAGLVALHARGRDYHKVLARRCRRLMDEIRALGSGFVGKAFVDSAPVAERSLAAACGVGWIGRNGCLYAPGRGSFMLLCEIVCNLPLVGDEPVTSRCGDCDLCVRACPTGALAGNGLVDARRCISYLTIEHKGPIDPSLWPLMGCRLFGCDACQLACPLNRDSPPGDPELRGLQPPLGGASLAEVLAWTAEDWDAATRGTAIRRRGCPHFIRNAVIAAGNSHDGSLVGALTNLLPSRPDLADLIGWAIHRAGQ
jgi:epoxyqueuosine reductase